MSGVWLVVINVVNCVKFDEIVDCLVVVMVCEVGEMLLVYDIDFCVVFVV